MMPIGFTIRAWLSKFAWYFGPFKVWLVATLLAAVLCAGLTIYWNYQAEIIDLEAQTVLKKIQSKRQGQRQSIQTQDNNAKRLGSAQEEQITQIELRLPPVQATKASPLGKFLSEAKLKGVSLKQVDYVWPKAARGDSRPLGKSLGVGKIDVNLNVEGSYLAVRAWLGDLLYEEMNVQVNAIQFQRVSRDSALVNGVITLSVYFQEAT
jgi:hypothetical protein